MQAPAAAFDVTNGFIVGFHGDYATEVHGVLPDGGATVSGPGTVYGINLGPSHLAVSRPSDGPSLTVPPYWYFAIPSRGAMRFEKSKALLVQRCDYLGMCSIGGPVESRGRLRYIDGCSDTVLISPPVIGDPVYNLLHFPPGITQTKHTHPTIRVGVVHEGEGVCLTENGEFPLLPGRGFVLWPDAVHSFNTREKPMTLTVFHPDSDCGPSHDDHPMLNRTIVDGVSASKLEHIRTQEI